jgi:small subunit ribosomal protein S1
MADDSENPSEDLDSEIADALGEQSILEIAGGILMPPTQRKAATGIETGRFAEGTVSGVGDADVFLEFGPRIQGVVPHAQFAEPPTVGDKLRVFVEDFDDKEGLYLCSVRRTVQTADWDGIEIGSILLGEVKAANAGGLELQCGVLSAFLPASHVALERVEDLESLVGQRYEVEVIEFDRDKRKLVVSRRGILGRQREAIRSEAVGVLQVGSTVAGKVTRVEKYGAFVDIGGVEGLLHVSEIAYKRVEDPSDHVAVGDDLKVQILQIAEDGKRISLSLKALQQDPWIRFTSENPPGAVVEGTVTRIASYGAFVEVTEGVEGLAHVSQLAPGPINSPKDVVRVGQKLSVRVAEVDPERRRVGLSLLTERGDRLTDDVADDATIRAVLEKTRDTGGEPTLGDLLKKAMEEGQA